MEGRPDRGKPFRRGDERRTHDAPAGVNRRVGDRRGASVDWIPLFRGTDEAAVEEALQDCEVLLLPTATVLLRPGESNHIVYILLSGKLAAYLDVTLEEDAAIPIGPGECIGELSAIDGKPASALVVAVTEARVLKLPGEVFWGKLMALPGVAGNLMTTLTERMRHTNELTLAAQREHLELVHLRKELDVARQLQTSMLPLQRPLFPECQDLEICGLMEPASTVGGDFFDAFFVDDNRLFFCIGDVSGHGIAAALFMARTIGLLRILARKRTRPDTLLANLNDRLCVGNETTMFVTLFCGFLEIDSGRFLYASAGHCAPVVSRAGRCEALPLPAGTLAGAFPGLRYACLEHRLDIGEILFCYTDGVTEAQDSQGDYFATGRCLPFLEAPQPLALSALLDGLRAEVGRFTGTALLEDDCTMLALRRVARPEGGATRDQRSGV